MSSETYQTYGNLKPHTITFVGGGPVAVAAIAEFCSQYEKLAQPRPRVTIHIVNSGDNFGRGSAFSEHENMVYCNTTTLEMSLKPGDPNHCLETLNAIAAKKYGPNDFPTRSDYGRYVEAYLDELESQIGPALGITIVRQTNTIGDIERNGQFKLFFDDGTKQAVKNYGLKTKPNIGSDQVFLTIGNLRSPDPFGGALQSWNGYIDVLDYSGFKKLQSFSEDTQNLSAAIIGLGPSGIDALRHLDNIGWRGKITAFSRESSLPWCYKPERDSDFEYKPQHLTVDALEALANEHITNNIIPTEISDSELPTNDKKPQVIDRLKNLIRDEIRSAEGKGLGGNSALYCHSVTDAFTNLHNGDDDFAREACAALSFFRGYRAPPKDLQIITRDLNAGRLKLIHGSALSAVSEDSVAHVEYLDYGSEKKAKLDCQLIINAAPYGRNCRDVNLTKAMRIRGGLLIHDRDTGAMDCGPHGELSARGLYAIGPGARYKGEHFSVAGIESFRKQATKAVAEAIKIMTQYHFGIGTPADTMRKTSSAADIKVVTAHTRHAQTYFNLLSARQRVRRQHSNRPGMPKAPSVLFQQAL